MKFHEICRNFMICAEFSYFGGNFTILGFWSVSSPPGELKNLNIPIGITRFSACGGQGSTRILQNVIFASFCRFSRNSAGNGEILENLRKIMVSVFFFRFLGFQAAQTLNLSKEYKGFVKGGGIQKNNDFHEIS